MACRVQILYTPASLAQGQEAIDELERIARDRAAGTSPRLSKAMLSELRASGWMRQARWRRGGYFTTKGIFEATGQPELVLLNVPSAFVPSAHRLLNQIADYILESGARLHSGEILALTDPNFPEMPVTFDRLEPGDMQMPEFSHPMLVVVPLP